MKLAVQLYTLRNELMSDFEGTLRQVAKLGYEGVEFAGFYNIPKQEMKALLQELNLTVVGSHTPIEQLDLDEVLNYNETIGNRNIIIPWTSMKTMEELEELSPKLNRLEERLQKYGFRLHYHNHAHELVRFNQEYLLDLLYQKVPKMYAEIDTHWVLRAGLNPIDYLKKYQGRNTLVHLKDMLKNKEQIDFAPLGNGVMDLLGIIKQAKENKVEALIVENDLPKNGGINDIAISMNYLKNVL